MKLMRGVLGPSKINLSRQFHSIKNSSAHRRVSIETPNIAHGSNIQLCGRSYAASASSNPLEARQGRRRVSKDERRSMVENYVKKYREANAGKFPTASDAQKNVGGSYYLVRQILQELIYNSKMPIMDTKDVLLDSSVKKEKEVSANPREDFQTKELQEPISQASKVDMEVTSSKILESKQGTQPIISVEDDKTKDVGHVHRLIDDPKINVHPDPEKNKQEETVHEDKLKFDSFRSKTETEESTEISGRKLHEEPTEDVEPQRKSTIWSNLKSFADGILSKWRRS